MGVTAFFWTIEEFCRERYLRFLFAEADDESSQLSAVIDRAEAVYAIAQQWPQDGSWVLHLKGSCSNPKAEASTLVAVNRGTFVREKSEVLREPATKKQVEDAVTALARSQS